MATKKKAVRREAGEGESSRSSTEGEHAAGHQRGKSPDWLGRVLAALAGATLTGGVFLLISERELQAGRIQLRSERESSVQNLRSQVFAAFAANVATIIEDEEDKKVALLAALHCNFHEVFDMRPVLETFARTITSPTPRHELLRLSRRVARQQAQFIKSHPVKSAKHGEMSKIVKLYWDPESDGPKEEMILGPHKVTVSILRKPERYKIPSEMVAQYEEHERYYKDEDDKVVDDIIDQVEIGIAFDEDELIDFTVSYMDAPYRDNLWMVHDDRTHGRLAVVLKDIDTLDEDLCRYSITLELLHFPGDFYTPTERPPTDDIK